jgi:hypothetical protein
MAVLLPNEDKHWLPAGWISKAFFDDALKVISEDPQLSELKNQIALIVEAAVDTLDFREATKPELVNLFEAVIKVITLYEVKESENIEDKHGLQIYLSQLSILRNTVRSYLLSDQSNNS